jgi:hypothetical protein
MIKRLIEKQDEQVPIQDTTFSNDVLGRFICNTLEEARNSAEPSRHADARQFDFIVIGGGSFGAVLAARLFNIDKSHAHRVLVIEAGPMVLPEHVQNLPPGLAAASVWGVPWKSDSPASWNQMFPGLAFCIGGRSLFWGGWSPYFIDSEINDPNWPPSVRDDLTKPVLPKNNPVESYSDAAARQLGTNDPNDFVSGPLQHEFRTRLFNALKNRVAGATPTLTGNRGKLDTEDDLEAPLAVQSGDARPGFFPLNKFNGVQLLIRAARVAQTEADQAAPFGGPEVTDVKKRLMVVNNTYLTRVARQGNRITRIDTNKGSIDVGAGGAVFLALGTIENTRLALNTVPEKNLIGRNLVAHLRSNLTFRIPRSSLPATLPPELQIAALFVKGIHTHADGSKGHFHLQITASGVGVLATDSEAELFKKIPNIDDLDQFKDLNDQWVVITVRGIGEMVGDKTSVDPQNRITLGESDGNGVRRALVRLETNPKDATDPRGNKDNDLWRVMDDASNEVARMLATTGPIEYLSLPNDPGNAVWQATPPVDAERRDKLSSTHHEAGTLWLGDTQATSVTDQWGRIWETENLYAVGPALLPRMGSPNPMLSGVALARRTADRLVSPPQVPPVDPGFFYLFDGTEKTFQRWRSTGPGSFALVGGLFIAQPADDHTVFFYAAEAFGDFILRLEFQLAGPVDLGTGKPSDNSGVYVRFRYPHRKWADLNALDNRCANNPAWVAVHSGFEVQIDELARPNNLDESRTGAIYSIPIGTGASQQKYQAGPALNAGDWQQYEIEVRKVAMGDLYIVRLNGQQRTEFTNTDTNRGISSAVDRLSGYIGVQAHTGKVAFRNVRLKKL